MSYIIKIKEKENKLFYDETAKPLVCGNSNYVIQFEFDDDWSAVETKIATFEILDKKIVIEFTGTTINMPAMPNAYYCMLSLTCTPGENKTLATPALIIYLHKNKMGIDVQTMEPFVGYYTKLINQIKKVENGEIVSGHADYATSSGSASTATYATTAGSATTATNATHATSADSATTATNATHATSADSATTATNATHATTADTATSATNATYATTAGTSETQVGLTGNQTIQGVKNFIGGIQKTGENIPNVTQVANENYILNSSFCINQREGTSYTGNNIYSIDRWKLGSTYSSATQDENGKWVFSLTGVTTAGSNVIFSQLVENYNQFAGQTMTTKIKFSALSQDIADSTVITIDDGVSTSSGILSSVYKSGGVTKTISENATKLEVKIETLETGKNASITPTWCKLEVGSYATMYQPRLYSHELWLCQRYYVKQVCDGQTGNFVNFYNIQPSFVLPNALRTTPTISVLTYPLVYGIEKTSGEYTYFKTNAFAFKKMQNNFIIFSITTGGNSTTMNFKNFCFYCLKNGLFALDAEIYE